MLVSCLIKDAKLNHLVNTVSLRILAWNLLPLPHSIFILPFYSASLLSDNLNLHSFAVCYSTCKIVLPRALPTINLLLKFKIFLVFVFAYISMLKSYLYFFCDYNLIFSLLLLYSVFSFVFLSLKSSMNGHLGCFQYFVFINNVSKNIYTYIVVYL